MLIASPLGWIYYWTSPALPLAAVLTGKWRWFALACALTPSFPAMEQLLFGAAIIMWLGVISSGRGVHPASG